MARMDLEDCKDKNFERVYMAGNQEEAKRVEALLHDNNVDYAVSLEPFTTVTGLIKGGSEKYGVAFYVPAGRGDWCRDIFVRQGLDSGILDDD